MKHKTVEITEDEYMHEPGCGQTAITRIACRKLGKDVFLLDYVPLVPWPRTYRYQVRKPHKKVTFKGENSHGENDK